MYSVVLLLAVTTGGESADLGRKGGCGGGGLFGGGGFLGGRKGHHGGCYGGGYGGCYGGGYGCYGGGYGCYGSGYGCYGSGWRGGCYGSSSYGCYGSGWGGGCYGSGYGCNGCYGSGMVITGGCYGSGGIIQGGCTGGVLQGGGVIVDKKEEKKNGGQQKKDGEKQVEKKDVDDTQVRATAAPATIVVSLPASAALSFNGQSVGASSSTKRTFQSPALAAGRAYTYDLKADYTKDGRAVSVRRQVRIEAGKTVEVDLTAAGTTAVASR